MPEAEISSTMSIQHSFSVLFTRTKKTRTGAIYRFGSRLFCLSYLFHNLTAVHITEIFL